MTTITVNYLCPDCSEQVEVAVEPLIPGRYWGPIERSYPDEGGTIEPDECPKCKCQFDTGKLLDIVEAMAVEAKMDKQLEAKLDREMA